MRTLIDSHGRTLNYMRVSVTDRCNLRCRYCMPEKGIEKVMHEEVLSFEAIEAVVRAGASLGVNKVRLTGGEPLVRKGIVSLVAMLKQVPGIEELSMTTNGILLKDYATSLKEAGLDRVNISLDTLDPIKFTHMTRGGQLQAVLEGIEAAILAGLTPIKINVVLMKGFNDEEIAKMVEWTRHEPVEVRFIELMPFGGELLWSNQQFMPCESVLAHVPELKAVDTEPASAAVLYALEGAVGRVGLISPVTCKFCEHCNRLRLTSTGKLKTCLHGNDEIDLSKLYANPAALENAMWQAAIAKPSKHRLEEGTTVNRHMVEIGG